MRAFPWLSPCNYLAYPPSERALPTPPSQRPLLVLLAGVTAILPSKRITSARALALLRQDDVGNFHAALRARELNPDIRLVVATALQSTRR